jgi:hypothetical protein
MIDPNHFLTRAQTSAALRDELGIDVPRSSLDTMASRGGGPKYYRFGNRALHRWGDTLEWIRGRLGPAITCAAELDAFTVPAPESAPHSSEKYCCAASPELPAPARSARHKSRRKRRKRTPAVTSAAGMAHTERIAGT